MFVALDVYHTKSMQHLLTTPISIISVDHTICKVPLAHECPVYSVYYTNWEYTLIRNKNVDEKIL